MLEVGYWEGDVGPSASGSDISTAMRWITVTFGADIHGSKRMTLPGTSELPDFPVASPAGQSFHLSREMSQHLLDGLTQNFLNGIHVSQN